MNGVQHLNSQLLCNNRRWSLKTNYFDGYWLFNKVKVRKIFLESGMKIVIYVLYSDVGSLSLPLKYAIVGRKSYMAYGTRAILNPFPIPVVSKHNKWESRPYILQLQPKKLTTFIDNSTVSQQYFSSITAVSQQYPRDISAVSQQYTFSKIRIVAAK